MASVETIRNEIGPDPKTQGLSKLQSIRKAIRRLQMWTGRHGIPFLTKVEKDRYQLRPLGDKQWFKVYRARLHSPEIPADALDCYMQICSTHSWSGHKQARKKGEYGGKKPSLLNNCYIQGSTT